MYIIDSVNSTSNGRDLSGDFNDFRSSSLKSADNQIVWTLRRISSYGKTYKHSHLLTARIEIKKNLANANWKRISLIIEIIMVIISGFDLKMQGFPKHHSTSLYS